MHYKHQTFSQQQGLENIPPFLQVDELPAEVRKEILYEINEFIENLSQPIFTNLGIDIQKIIKDFYAKAYIFDSGLRFDYPYFRIQLQNLMVHGTYNKIFDALLFLLNHPFTQKVENEYQFALKISEIFERRRMGYLLIKNDNQWLILPRASEQEGQNFLKAVHDLSNLELEGTRYHLINAAEKIKRQDYAGSIQDSIHAVDSLIKKLIGSTGETNFANDIRNLNKQLNLHPAMIEAFIKLYGYSSDEKGIRHCLDGSYLTAIDQATAQYFLGTCSAMVSLILSKYMSLNIAVQQINHKN